MTSWKLQVLTLLLRPSVSFALRNSLYFREVGEMLKAAFVEAAAKELKRKGEKVSVSRIAVMTGVHREDVKRIQGGAEGGEKQPVNLIARVLAVWESGKGYQNSRGRARALIHSEERKEFYELVRTVSKSINPATVLKELFSLGMVEISRNRLTLRRPEALFVGDKDQAYELVARDEMDLYRAGEDNIERLSSVPHLHIRTEFDNIYKSDLGRIRAWVQKEGQAFHKRVREFLSAYDKDVSSLGLRNEEAGQRVVVTSFAFSDPLPGPVSSKTGRDKGGRGS